MKTTTTVALVLAAAVAGTLAGCGVSIGDSQETRSTTDVSQPSTDVPETAPPVVATSEPAPAPSAAPYDGDVESLLTPPGATVVASQGGELVLMSSDSVDTLASFYDGALARLGAQRSEAADVGSAWGYDGTYGDGRSLQIAVVEAGGMRTVAISY